jgi:N-methylhydantoinase A
MAAPRKGHKKSPDEIEGAVKQMGYRVGVDIGGTFTDFCVFNEESGELHAMKVLSTPENPGTEIVNGLRQCAEHYGIDPEQISHFTHGQTVGINTVIQRKGARLALFVTENFREVLELERLRLDEIFNLRATRPTPLITRDCVIGIRERQAPDGSETLQLDENSVRDAVEQAKRLKVDGIIVSFLHAHRNGAHENQAAEIIRQTTPELFIFTSSEVWPVIREFERTITATINGYVHPRVKQYLASIQQSLQREGVPVAPLVAKSNGGVMSVERGQNDCVQILLSGTASGVMGASHIAEQCGLSRVLSLDIGGTSADVALVIDGKAQFAVGEQVGDFRVFIPSVAVSSIGAGGGSIAWLDPLGVLKVGPESAGSDPGPACFGKGDRPTLTDAFAVCGFLPESSLGFNAVTMSLDRSYQAVSTLADRLGMDVKAAAEAIIKVGVSEMYLELNKVMARYGTDPREFALLPFGGAGPMLASFLGRELGIGQVVVPTAPGVLSALGGLYSDIRNDFIRTVYLRADQAAIPDVLSGLDQLRHEALEWLKHEVQYDGEPQIEFLADMRYVGQSYEIDVVLTEEALARRSDRAINALFHQRHEELFDYNDTEAAVEIVNLRATITGVCPKPRLARMARIDRMPPPTGHSRLYYDGMEHEAAIYHRSDLGPGIAFDGPCIITQADTTTCVLGGYRCSVDDFGNLHLHYSEQA